MRRFVPFLLFVLLVAVPGRAADLMFERWDKFVVDAKMMREGKPTLVWPDPEKNTSVRSLDVKGDLSSFRTLSFWMHVPEKKKTQVVLLFFSENPATEGYDYYPVYVKTDWQGWRFVQVSLAGLKPMRQPRGWDKIDYVMWSSNWAKMLDPTTVIHLSDMRISTDPIPGMEEMAGEMLPNRSFENDANSDGAPDGWGLNAFSTAPRVKVVSGGAHSGHFAVHIAGGDAAFPAEGLFITFGPEKTDGGTTHSLSAWVKSDTAGAPGAAARISAVDAAGNLLESKYLECGAGPHGWKEFKWNFALPEGTRRFHILLMQRGSGAALWDDVSLRKIENPNRAKEEGK